MNNIYVEIKEKCCSQCYAECDGCWLEELITDRLAEERKKVVQEIREKALKREIFYTGDKSKSEWKNEYCIFDFELKEIERNGK